MDYTTSMEDSQSFVEAIAAYHQVSKDQVFVGVGSDDVLAMSFMTFFNSAILHPYHITQNTVIAKQISSIKLRIVCIIVIAF